MGRPRVMRLGVQLAAAGILLAAGFALGRLWRPLAEPAATPPRGKKVAMVKKTEEAVETTGEGRADGEAPTTPLEVEKEEQKQEKMSEAADKKAALVEGAVPGASPVGKPAESLQKSASLGVKPKQPPQRALTFQQISEEAPQKREEHQVLVLRSEEPMEVVSRVTKIANQNGLKVTLSIRTTETGKEVPRLHLNVPVGLYKETMWALASMTEPERQTLRNTEAAEGEFFTELLQIYRAAQKGRHRGEKTADMILTREAGEPPRRKAHEKEPKRPREVALLIQILKSSESPGSAPTADR